MGRYRVGEPPTTTISARLAPEELEQLDELLELLRAIERERVRFLQPRATRADAIRYAIDQARGIASEILAHERQRPSSGS